MMNNVLLLLKVRMFTQLGLNTFKYEKDKRKKKTKWLISITIGFVLLTVMLYCGGLAYGLIALGIPEVIPAYACLLSSAIAFFFTLFKANGEIFAFKDYDLVMSLPISVRVVIASRFLYLYLVNTFLALLIVLPMGIVYSFFERPSAIFYFMGIISLFTICLIPTTIAVVFGALVTALAVRFNNTGRVTTLLNFAAILFLFFFMTTISDNSYSLDDLENIGALLADLLLNVYPLATLFQQAMVNKSMAAFALFSGLSIAGYLFFVQFLSIYYKQINSRITAYSVHSSYQIGAMKKNRVTRALYKKELQRFFSSSVYVVNTGMGVAMALFLSFSFLFSKNAAIAGYPGIEGILQKVAPFALSAMISMTCTTCVSLSLEGKSIWIIKSLPLTPKMIYNSKILVNLTLTIPVSVVCSVLMIIALKPDFWTSALLIVTPIVYSFFTAVWGIFVANRFAYYDWESETQVVKQSIAALLGLFGGMIFAVIPAFLAGAVSAWDDKVFTFAAVVLLSVVTALLYKNDSVKPVR